jgi:hypothetical protein
MCFILDKKVEVDQYFYTVGHSLERDSLYLCKYLVGCCRGRQHYSTKDFHLLLLPMADLAVSHFWNGEYRIGP